MIDRLTLVTARMDSGLSVPELCAWLGRSERTWRHWLTHGGPDWVLDAIRLRAGHLDTLGWRGWRIFKGTLYAADTNQLWSVGDLYAEWWNRQRLRGIDRERRKESLRARRDDGGTLKKADAV